MIAMKHTTYIDRLFYWADSEMRSRNPFLKSLHTLVKVICIAEKEFRRNELNLRAAALTYTVMLSLIPVLAMSTAVVKGLGGGDQLRIVIYNYVNSLDSQKPSLSLPEGDEAAGTAQPPASANSPTQQISQDSAGTDLSGHLHEAIDMIFDYVDRTNFARLGTFGVLGIVISVILVFSTIETAMNSIWSVESGRSIARKISDYLALLILLPFSLNVGIAASTILKNRALQEKFSHVMPVLFQGILLKLLPVFFLALTLYVIYIFFPNTKVKTIPAVIGAALAGFFWFEMQNIYISLQIGVSKYNAIYGSFATLPLFLVWMYLGWIFILIGAQVAYACQNRKHYRIVPPKAEPSLQLCIAYDLRTFILNSFDNRKEVTLDDFLDAYGEYPLRIVEATADRLISRNLLHLNGEKEYIKPSLPRHHFTDERVIEAVIGKTFSKTEGGEITEQGLAAAAGAQTPQLASRE